MKDEQLNQIAHLLLLVPALMHRKINRDVVKVAIEEGGHDLAPHHVFILKILQDEGHMCMAEVGKIVSISKSQMTASTEHLIKKEFIQRQTDENDRRKIILSITPAGDSIISKIDRSIKRQMRGRLLTLSSEEQHKLQHALQDLIDIHNKF